MDRFLFKSNECTEMLSKAKIKYLLSLQRKKYRQRYNKFIVEGVKIVDEILVDSRVDIEYIIGTREWFENHKNLPDHKESIVVENQELKQISSLSQPNEVLVSLSFIPYRTDEVSLLSGTSLFLDGLQDPGNVGTIIRTAEWFGITQILLGKGTVDVYNPKVLQATMGSILRVSCVEKDILELKETYRGRVTFWGADMKGIPLDEIKKEERNGIIVIGNEGNGISEEARSVLDSFVNIPRAGESEAESLNAGIAAAILCYAFQR